MVKGVLLTLMVGPVVPTPVPAAALEVLQDVTVFSSAEPGTPSGFELKFMLRKRSPLETVFLLASGVPVPLIRVIIVVTLNGVSEVLIDGVVTKQQVSPGADPGHSVLTITGVDLTALMDLVSLDGLPYPALPSSARVLLILAKYAVFGVVPMVIPSPLLDVPNPLERTPVQQGTDLNYINLLASRTGYVFFVKPGPKLGMSIAYWGPDVKIGVPQPALNINMDAHTNVEALNFSLNGDKRVLPTVYIQDLTTKRILNVPIPPISPLNPPLGAIPLLPLKIQPTVGTAKMSVPQALMVGWAKASRSCDAVEGEGKLDVLRYGRTLKARGLVGVRGAGTAFDGLHYVRSVTHHIQRGEYKQDFQLIRNGLISTLPRVPA